MNKRFLITPPREWVNMKFPVAPPSIPVIAEQGGTQLRVPPAVLLVDSREQDPFDFEPYGRWFSAIKKAPLKLGDYAIEGMEDRCVVERKSLSDLVKSLTQDRAVFVRRLRLMAEYPDRLLVVDAPMSKVRARYEHSAVNPNQITQSLHAIMTGLRIQTFFAETHDQGSEFVAWYLFNAHHYRWLELNGHDRMLSDDDL
jgi:ERCC4-type nuclease